VTVGDQARIARHTGSSNFWEFRAPSEPEYLDQDHDPNWLKWVFRPDGTRPILKRRPDGGCMFLSATGCSLPMEVRPLVCRLYPYTYTEHGIDGVSDECPPAVIPPRSTILDMLDMRLADAERWHKMLYTELRLGKPHHENRPYLRSA